MAVGPTGRHSLVSPKTPKKLIVEGGGEGKSSRIDCRRGFKKFLEHAGLTGPLTIDAGGTRGNAFRTFSKQVSESMLLVDSEDPVDPEHRDDPWLHLKKRDGWDRPAGATNDQCQLMVQLLEAWFLADPEALAGYFRKGFKRDKLGKTTDIESVSKADVYERLKRATKETLKGNYDKGRDTAEIMERLDPAKVRARSHFADRLLCAFGL